MDNHRMQELIRVYEEKMDLPDPPHCYTLRCLTETSAWIRALAEEDRGMALEYIGYILDRPGDSALKTKTAMLIDQLPDWRQTPQGGFESQ